MDPRGARDPAIFAHALGLFYRFPLNGDWRRVHITVTEVLGPALAALVIAPRLPHSRLLVQGDASTALAFLKGRPRSECLQRIYRLWCGFPHVSAFLERAWAEHVSGIGNTIDDAGSRGLWHVLFAYAAALDVRLTEIKVDDLADMFMSQALAIALEYSPEHPPQRTFVTPPRATAPIAAKPDPVLGVSSQTPRSDEAIVHMTLLGRGRKRSASPPRSRPPPSAPSPSPSRRLPSPSRLRSTTPPRATPPSRPASHLSLIHI